MSEKELTQEWVRSKFYYVPGTGQFYRYLKEEVMKPVGKKDKQGYVMISVFGKPFRAHRLAFMYMEGFIPKYVDHINEDKSDNRWVNLRPCTVTQNSLNRGKQRNNKTGFKNVQVARNGKFTVRVSGNHIGTFEDLELADLVAQCAREIYHKEFCKH